MKLDDPRAVDFLKDLIEQETKAKDKRDARLNELRPLHEEYLKLEQESGLENIGKSGIGGLRVQLAWALLYKEIGTSHLPQSAIGAVCAPASYELPASVETVKVALASNPVITGTNYAPNLIIDKIGKGYWK